MLLQFSALNLIATMIAEQFFAYVNKIFLKWVQSYFYLQSSFAEPILLLTSKVIHIQCGQKKEKRNKMVLTLYV